MLSIDLALNIVYIIVAIYILYGIYLSRKQAKATEILLRIEKLLDKKLK